MKRILIVALSATIASSAFGVNLYSNQSSNVNVAALNFSTTTRSGVTAAAGSMWSEVQANGSGVQTESNTNAGSSVHLVAPGPNFRLADDFTVSGAGWNVTGIAVFAYQTGSTSNPVTGGNMNLWSGRPGETSSVIIGTATWSNATDQLQLDANTVGIGNRIFNTNSPAPGSAPGTTRRIWQSNFTLNQTLAAGTYWIDYQLTTTAGSLFAPTTTHQDVRGISGANARQLTTTGWVDVIDGGNPAAAPDVAQDMPFIISGEAVPEPMTMGVLALGAAALAARKRRKS
ncbi:hypothetical protein C0431_05520 [bacterium]|nr:hypothetical protein [bacterium]